MSVLNVPKVRGLDCIVYILFGNLILWKSHHGPDAKEAGRIAKVASFLNIIRSATSVHPGNRASSMLNNWRLEPETTEPKNSKIGLRLFCSRPTGFCNGWIGRLLNRIPGAGPWWLNIMQSKSRATKSVISYSPHSGISWPFPQSLWGR